MNLPLDRDTITRHEPWVESVFWVAIVGCMLLVHLPGETAHLLSIYWMGVVLVLCMLVWYHLLPKSWIGFRKAFYGAVSSIMFITAFLCWTGGIHSRFGLLYLLPILVE